MRFVVTLMAARMSDILCAAILRNVLNSKDISGDFTAFDYRHRRYKSVQSSARLLPHIIRI